MHYSVLYLYTVHVLSTYDRMKRLGCVSSECMERVNSSSHLAVLMWSPSMPTT